MTCREKEKSVGMNKEGICEVGNNYYARSWGCLSTTSKSNSFSVSRVIGGNRSTWEVTCFDEELGDGGRVVVEMCTEVDNTLLFRGGR